MDLPRPEGEFHHYQIVDPEGNVPFSISILVHLNNKSAKDKINLEPITTADMITFHKELESFDGDFLKSFSEKL